MTQSQKDIGTIFDKDCDVWIEKACKDKTCDFCPTRPEKPSEVTE